MAPARHPFLVRLAVRLAVAFALGGLAACHDHEADTTTPTEPVVPVPAVTVDSGSNLQLAIVGHPIHVAVTATDAQGNPLANRDAAWRVETGGGALSVASTVTDAGGHTGVDWTLGTTAGPNTLSVTIDGARVTITATGAPDALHALVKVSPDPLTLVPSASAPLVVRAVDQYGNPIEGVVVTWSGAGGQLAPASTTTGSSGNAQTTFTTDPTPATYQITATAPGVVPAAFVITTH